ncbi:unnamed protein product [Euphydryas editha]|uniref:Uncharacterized protein n=1 Tax=Euphydryas editha TaxID=104508 RepID=A0AAU9TLQ1_EUPED|nr:unnamed protein product [Euphydryas editha]CAH2085595.1 unnamed protein product [Euphydryas editha]
MIEHENNNSNKQENSQNVYIRHDCAIQEQLLRSQYKNENLKRLNTETRQTNYTSNKNTDLLNQIHVEYLNNYNVSDNKRNSTNETMSVVPILGKNDDIAKNISSSNIQAEQKVYGQLYPEHLSYDPKLTSLFNQPVATNPANHSSNVVWKPVNVVPVLPGLASPSTVTINNNSSIYLNNQDVSRGIFNFHSAPDMLSAGTQYVPRMHPQYVLAYPFSGSSD